jgi:hypothetical protein
MKYKHEMYGEAAKWLLVHDPAAITPIYDVGDFSNDICVLNAESPVWFDKCPTENSRVTLKMFPTEQYNPEYTMDKFFSTIFGTLIGRTQNKIKQVPHHHRRLVCNKKFKENKLSHMCECTSIVVLDYLGDNDLIGCMDQEYTGVITTIANTFGAFVRFSSFTAYHVI